MLFAVAMAVAIVGVSWSNYRNALAAADSLNRSRARFFHIGVERELRRGDSLIELITDHDQDGLRYVAVYGDQGRLFGQAGEPSAPPPEQLTLAAARYFEQAPLVQLERRVRTIALTGPPRRSSAPRPGSSDTPGTGPGVEPGGSSSIRGPVGGPEPAGGTPPSGDNRPSLAFAPTSMASPQVRPRALLVEFEPTAALRLTDEAFRTLTISAIVAMALLGAAGVVWYLLRRREEYLLLLERQDRLSALGEMAAVLAHEIRNPLASLKGHAQLLAERFEAGALEHQKADRIVREATRLEKLTTNLLDFARAGSLTRSDHDPLEPLQSAIDNVTEATVELDTAASPRSWSLDPDAIQQLLTNVLQNAAQATPPGHTVQVGVGTEGGQLVYRVRDQGPGIAPGLESRIFEPFVTTRTRGVGLGLAVAQRIARLHGGTISVSTHPEGGASFRIAIPAH